MWVYMKDGFVSIVKDRDEQGTFLVRARKKEHLEEFLSEWQVDHTPDADYPYRVRRVRPGHLAAALLARLYSISYGNFKAAIDDPAYQGVCAMVYAATVAAMEEEE